MRKAKELVGKAIIHLSTGAKLATVHDLLFDNEARRIVALLTGGGWWSNPQFVRWSSVVSFSDVVVVQGEAPLAVVADDPEVAELLKRGSPMTGTTIISDGGERIGTVGELFVDDRGNVVGYEVSQGFISDLSGRKFLPVEQIQTVGKDAVIATASELPSLREATRAPDVASEPSTPGEAPEMPAREV
jgi:uncharacterized protein YrrD